MRGSAAKDLAGMTFGRLTAVARDGYAGKKVAWLCRCSCGAEKRISRSQLTGGKARSCGCLQREEAAQWKTTHGATKRGERWPEWGVWRQMINRCHRKTTSSFPRYGGRGVSVCDRWRHGDGGLTGFQCFIADMGRRPSDEYSIERKNNDGNYEPANCKWATILEQAANRRPRTGKAA